MVVTAEFPPIQLGFGFELHALGGILGVHRRADVDVLRDGVAEGTLTDVFFPDDPVGRAPQLIARLEAAFPAREGQYVFGPSARLAWGAPVMVTLDVALALELPAPVRLLIAGRLEARAPRPEQPLVALNMDVLGVIDFGRGPSAGRPSPGLGGGRRWPCWCPCGGWPR